MKRADVGRQFQLVTLVFALTVGTGIFALVRGYSEAWGHILFACVLYGICWYAKRSWDRRPRP